MNDEELNMNELNADDGTAAEASDSTEQAATETSRAASGRPRQPGSLPRLLVRVCLGLVTVIALATIFFRGGESSGLNVDDATFVLNLKPAEVYGTCFVEFNDQRLEDESSIQNILAEQNSNGLKQVLLRTSGGVAQKEIDRISRLIRRNLPETRIVIAGSSGFKNGGP